MLRDARPILVLLVVALASTTYLACGSNSSDDSGNNDGFDFDGAVHRDVSTSDQSSDAPATIN